jgi:NAD(P)-dependent dehydrogenase (short-subunit alcohol dehydrogenase family)
MIRRQRSSRRGWTPAQMPDQSGRTVVVTGANSGLGLHTTMELARRGAHVVMACRDSTRGSMALEQVTEEVPQAYVETRPLDLADLASVRAFVAAWAGPLDLLVNNAGVMALPYRRTADGFEMQLGTNHLGHFALTGLLLPSLLESPAPRVVTVSSWGHRGGRIRFDDLQGERRYGRWAAYAQSKLANLLFAAQLQRRADASGTKLLSVAAHPGSSHTNLQSVGPSMSGRKLRGALTGWSVEVFGQPVERAVWPMLYAATMPDVRGGEYFGPDGFLQQRGYPKRVGRSSQADDRESARQLWDVSERLTGVTYDFGA